jgi:hypothetical protein
LEVGVVFAEFALLFLGEGRTVRELVADGPRLGLFFASSSSTSRVRRSIDCTSVLVCFLPLLVPRLLGGSFEAI